MIKSNDILTINTCDICGSICEVKNIPINMIKRNCSSEGVCLSEYKTTDVLDICKTCRSKINNYNNLYCEDCYGFKEYYFGKIDLIDKLTKEGFYEKKI